MNDEHNTTTSPGLSQPGSTDQTQLYEVEIHRTEYRAATVFVLADDQQQAEEKATEMIGTDQFKTADADQYVYSASLVPAELAKNIRPTTTTVYEQPSARELIDVAEMVADNLDYLLNDDSAKIDSETGAALTRLLDELQAALATVKAGEGVADV